MQGEIKNHCELFLRTFIEWSNFRLLFLDNWSPDWFADKTERVIYQKLQEQWQQNHIILKKSDITTLVVNNTKIGPDGKERLLDKIENVYSLDLTVYTESFIRDYLITVIRRRKLNDAITKLLIQVEKEGLIDENQVRSEILDSIKLINADDDELGIDYFNDDVLDRMTTLKEYQMSQFKTNMNSDLDEVLKLKRKTTVAISAETNVGKSLFLNNLAANFSKDGYNVLYLSLEMDAYDISKRVDKIIFDFEDDSYIVNPEIMEKKMIEYKKLNPQLGQMMIQSYAPRSLTSFQIKNILEQLRVVKNIGIDIILLDYLTLMQPTKKVKDEIMYARGKEVAEDLRALAKDERILIFTALQVNRGAYGNKKQGADTIAESLAIPQLLDTLINMTEKIVEDGGVEKKYFLIGLEKVRDGRKSKKKIYLKLQDNLKIVSVTNDEVEKLESLMEVSTKRKFIEPNQKDNVPYKSKNNIVIVDNQPDEEWV